MKSSLNLRINYQLRSVFLDDFPIFYGAFINNFPVFEPETINRMPSQLIDQVLAVLESDFYSQFSCNDFT